MSESDLSFSSSARAARSGGCMLGILLLSNTGCLPGSDLEAVQDAGESSSAWDGGEASDGEVQHGEASRDAGAYTHDADALPEEPSDVQDASIREDSGVREDASIRDDASAGDEEDAGRVISCVGRKGGALISIYADGEDMTFHATNEDFIVDAFLACAKGTLVTVNFRDLLEGADCDGRFTWHPHPDHIVLSDSGDESCDARFSEVEADKASWVEPMKQYCPSQVLISAVQSLGE